MHTLKTLMCALTRSFLISCLCLTLACVHREFQTRVQRGQDAKARMLKANYRLVIKVVKAYQNRGMSLQDLIAEGMQGLLRGVEKFEVDKGFRFSTYAHWWIRQAVTRALQEQARTVR